MALSEGGRRLHLNPETALGQALDRSSAIQEQICTLLNGRRIPALSTDKRTKIASALFMLTIEQADSVTFLFQNERYGAGLALIRPVVEAYNRGRWIKYHAKIEAIETFSFKKAPKKMSLVIEETMSRFPDPNGKATAFCSEFSRLYGLLSKFVHADVDMFGMQLSESGLASQYDLEKVIEVLKISDVMQLIAALELIDFARCESDEYCQSLKETHAQCKWFQADVEKITTFLGAVFGDG